jgi:hypothetical protein
VHKHEVLATARGRVILMDSITGLDPGDRGAIIVSGSHGGTSAAEFALAVAVLLVVFNDAGVGKDEAGVAALRMLQARGMAAATVAHTSARIGDARDAWEHGVVSHANRAAERLGIVPGVPLRLAIDKLLY